MTGVGQLTIGTHARTADGIVFIFGYEGDCYQTARTDREEEGEYFAGELAPWSPEDAECVTEADSENGVTGIVVVAGEETSLVKWKEFIRPQVWLNANLQPAWVD